MKTSFYFLLWFIVYFLIGMTGSQFLIQNDFVVALVFVLFISSLDRKLFHKEKEYQANLNRAFIFEIFYTNDAGKMADVVMRRVISQAIWTVYCILTVFGLWVLHTGSFVIYLVFGFIGIMSAIASAKFLSQYREIKENGLPPFDESRYAEDAELYQEYCRLRPSYSAKDLQPKAPAESKWVNIVSIIFSVGCICIGFYYLAIMALNLSNLNVLLSAMAIWALLAVYFGIKDLIGSICILQKKPIPSLE